jgi:hypothetical protein
MKIGSDETFLTEISWKAKGSIGPKMESYFKHGILAFYLNFVSSNFLKV